jgi:type IV pilus assembly protein PilE
MENGLFTKKLKAFTLSELLVVLVIVGILVLLALPSLMPLISRTRSLEAKQMLKHLQTLEKMYFFENAKYSTDLRALGFEQQKLVTDGEDGKANYKIEVFSATNGGFKARATSVTDFDKDGQFNVWEIDQDMNLKEVTED